MYRGLRVAVVIPAHDEAELLPITLDGLPPWIDHALVVDDASADGTAEVAHATGAPGLEVIRHARNRGVGGAIVTGYQRALALGVDAAVVMGADAQMDPDELPGLLDPLVEDAADYVKGDRLGHPDLWRRMPLVRLLGNLALTRLTRLATGYRQVRDSQCGYTAINQAALRHLPLDALYARYGFPNDLLAKLAALGARVIDRPVSPIYGDERSGLRPLRVIGPISLLLARATLQRALRALRRRDPAPELPAWRAAPTVETPTGGFAPMPEPRALR